MLDGGAILVGGLLACCHRPPKRKLVPRVKGLVQLVQLVHEACKGMPVAIKWMVFAVAPPPMIHCVCNHGYAEQQLCFAPCVCDAACCRLVADDYKARQVALSTLLSGPDLDGCMTYLEL
jgi:hypothetical protein